MKRFFLSALIASLPYASTWAQFVPLTELPNLPEAIPATNTTHISPPTDHISGFEQAPEGGSETVARLLEKLEPSVDTRLPETASQSANRIQSLIQRGHYDSALHEISKLRSPDGHIASPQQDVQLRFLEARAYFAKGDLTKAQAIYQEMTFNYPELAEPWNNLAIIQWQRQSLNEALASLQMALTIRPNYPIAHQNLGLVYLALAEQAFKQAAKQGSKAAATQAKNIQQIIR